jgi:hypothetical protein
MGDVSRPNFGGGSQLPPPPPRIRPLGVFWHRMRLSTMPPDESLRFEGGEYLMDVGAIMCRGRMHWTCVLPNMGARVRPEYLTYPNDN